MKRRNFMIGAAALATGAGALFAASQRMQASADYPGRALGHRLRDAKDWPAPTETLDTEVLIAGSGVAALTAAWRLGKAGLKEVLMISGPETYGNAAGGADGELRFPTGAHYLPLPSMASRHIREMLHEFGIIQKDPFAERPTYDERYLVHGPAERVLFKNRWQDGYLPTEGVSGFERAEHARFFGLIDEYTNLRGSDGKRAFEVPTELSSQDPALLALDRVSLRAWLEGNDLRSPTLLWYLDYCCRDDYGRHMEEISAWAGLHYFCSRDGQASNAERGAVLTWPQGLSELAIRLDRASGAGERRMDGSVVHIASQSDGRVEALVLTGNGERMVRIRANQLIAAMPLYVLVHVCPELTRSGFASSDVPRYAPWLVSNFILRAFPAEHQGVPLSWDNVVFNEPGLGYVVSTHQDIRLSRPERTAFTAYYALSETDPDRARRWLDRASLDQLEEAVSRDLKLAYGWRLPWCVERIAITARGHAMAIPEPGFRTNAGRRALQQAEGPIYIAHSDLSGLSLFEEAAWWGQRAAERIIAKRS